MVFIQFLDEVGVPAAVHPSERHGWFSRSCTGNNIRRAKVFIHAMSTFSEIRSFPFFFKLWSFFTKNALCIGGLRHGVIKMDASNDEEIMSSQQQPTEKKPKKPRSNKARPPARPFKRVETDVLKVKLATFKKQAGVLESKLTLLRDKMEKHEEELNKRDEETEE